MTPHICFDRILPSDLRRPQKLLALGNGRFSAISPIGKLWINGSTLRVRFLGGTAAQQAIVKQYMPEWSKYANLNFEFSNAADAEIRVSFLDDGAWSYIGTDARGIPTNEPTMNFGWLDEAVVLHEVGHAIGLAHEHSNPDGGLQWNEAAVIRDLSGPPNYWDEATIRFNVLEKYARDQINGTAFDPDSIMLYAFPATWTINGVSTKENTVLSSVDKAFAAGAKMYPGRGAPAPTFVELPVFEPVTPKATAASIGAAGEEDRFVFRVKTAGRYTIQTEGKTDVVMKLFGPNSQTLLIAEDDDSGEGTNSLLTRDLAAGEYYLQIRHYNRTGGTGAYGVSVVKA